MKKTLLTIFTLGVLITPLSLLAQNTNDYEVVPEAEDSSKVQGAVNDVGSKWWSVREKYNQQADNMEGEIGNQMASGIMTRDTLLDYVVYLVRFLSQIGIVIGVVMIIYAGYLYATSVFNPSGISKGKSAITNAIIGVLVVAFSYAIMKLLTSAFLS